MISTPVVMPGIVGYNTHRADLVHVDDDGRARARTAGLGGDESIVLGCTELMDSPWFRYNMSFCTTHRMTRYRTCAKEADDTGRAVEGIEHECNAAVLAQVGDGLDAATGQVLVPDTSGGDDMEGVAHALGGDVYMRLGTQGRGCDPEDLLLEQPRDDLGRDGFVEFAHVVATAASVPVHGVGGDPCCAEI